MDAFTAQYRDPGEQACIDSQSGFGYAERPGKGFYCGADFTGLRTIRNERDTLSGYVNANYQITDDTELYTDVLYSSQDSLIRSGNHWVGEYVLELAEGGAGNFGPLDYVLKQRQFGASELGWRDTDYEESSILVNLGARGTIWEDYDWDLTLSRSENTSDSSRPWIKEEEVFPIFFGTGSYGYGLPNGVSEVDLYAPITADIRDRLMGNQVITSDSYTNNISFVLSGAAFEMPAGDAYFAVVAEYNKQGYTLTQDERTLNKDGNGWYGLTGTEGGGDRSRYAAGVELNMPLMENLDATIAGRYDKYDDDTTDIGGRFTTQVGFTYNPTDDILMRANWGQSFRAPDMHRVFAGPSGFYTSAYDWVKCEIDYDCDAPFEQTSDFCDGTSIQGFSSGSKILQEEEGDSYGVGFVWDMTEDFNISVDWYAIELQQIVVSESVQGLLNDAYDCKFGLEGRDSNGSFCQQVNDRIIRTGADDIDPGQIQEVNTGSINAAEHSIEGIDATIGYHFENEYGEFNFKLGWSHVLEMVYKADDEDTNENDRDKAWNDDARSVINGSISWNNDDTAVTLSARRIGSIPAWIQPLEYSDKASDSYGDVDRLHPYITVNLTASYQYNEDLSFNVHAVNMFNNKPPKDDSHEGWPYYNGFQYGGAALGRQVGAEVRYTF
jgi:outer membrane receptor protein involved in Fe transport